MRIVMLLDNPFSNDLRVMREARTLADAGYRIEVYCLKKAGLSDAETTKGISVNRVFDERIFDIKKPLYLRKVANSIIKEFELTTGELIVLHCHDQTMLHLGAIIKKRMKNAVLIYDSHEMFHSWPLNLSDPGNRSIVIKSTLVRKWQVIREGRNARYIDYLISVSDSITEELKHYFRLRGEAITIRNMPAFYEIREKPAHFRSTFNIDAHTSIVLFMAGNLYEKSQNLLQAIDDLGNKEGVAFVILSGNGPGKTFFEAHVKDRAYTNVYFHDKIPAGRLIEYASGCDVGLLPYWNKSDLSYWYALPNKLFEYIMAEIPILSTIQPEFKKIIEHYNVGLCIDPEETDAFGRGLDELLKQQSVYRENLLKAKQLLSWDKEKEKLSGLYAMIHSKHSIRS